VFARAIVIRVQPGCAAELAWTLEQQVIPLFQKERDFRGLLAFTVPDGTEALSLSLWDQKERLKGFWMGTFAALVALTIVALGKSSVQVCEVWNSPRYARGQVQDQGTGMGVSTDLKIYQSALQPYKLEPTGASLGRGFPLIWCLINSFQL